MKRVGLALLMALMTLAAAVAVTTSASAHDPDRRESRAEARAESLIVGTWQIRSSNPSIVGPASMLTFTPGGGFIWVGNASTTTSIGSWEHLGGRRFADSSQAFRVSPELAYQGRFVLRSEFTITRDDQLVGSFEYDVFTPAGARTFGGEGSLSGTRYAVEPLN